jgi:type II secretory ATPase GspE/PulE/Tfp pilus assembly ATPase PilB-like protein
MTLPIIPIAVFLGIFFFWTWNLVQVHRHFRHTGGGRTALTLTFYTMGVAGVLIKIGRRSESGPLAKWVETLGGRARGSDEVSFVAADEQGEVFDGEFGEPSFVDLAERGGEEGVLPVVREILSDAVKEQATDIHLEPEEDQLKVRCRLDGVLQTRGSYPASMSSSVISALKVQAGMDVAEKRRAQDGSFSIQAGGRHVDFRASTVGTSQGEKMVLRVLDQEVGLRELEELGLSKEAYQELKGITESPYGMLVVCGPTGAGKTTTLYAVLQEIDRSAHNVVTIENPIEYNLENVTQHAVNEKADISFASLLRTALRQDPDILMVGEVRDTETAEIAMQAAMTGHFVYTTVHANDTVSASFRLLNLGVESYLISSAVSAILAQRLVRRLCPNCREEYRPTAEDEEVFEKAGMDPERIDAIYRPSGCTECRDTGYRGRVGVFELLSFDDELRSLIQQSPTILDIRRLAEKKGIITLRRDALEKVVRGVTSVDEAVRVTR